MQMALAAIIIFLEKILLYTSGLERGIGVPHFAYYTTAIMGIKKIHNDYETTVDDAVNSAFYRVY